MFCCARPKVVAAQLGDPGRPRVFLVTGIPLGGPAHLIAPPKGIPCYGYFHGRMCRTALGALGDLWWVLGARGFLWGGWGLVGGRGERTDRTRAFIRRQYGAHGPPATASAKVRRRPGEKARPRAVAGLGRCYSDW